MFEILAVACGALIAGGAVAVIAGTRRVERPVRRRQARAELWSRVRSRAAGWGIARTAGSVVAGIVATIITGWPIMVVVVPAVILGLPRLLSAPPNRDIELLEALDRWVRLLAATLSTGVSIPDAVRSTRRQVPHVLVEPVTILLARLDDRWSIRQSLHGMADDLDSPDADAVIAALTLAAERGGTGAVAALQALADSISDRLKAAREIEAERAKPRIVVRQVTVLTLVILGAAFLLGRDFFAPYGTWYGQIILSLLLAAYLASLVWLRRMSAPSTRERILQ